MARLRFPGRPGCRFDRLGVRYGADEAKNVKDPTLILVANIHRGLRLFRELFGESDEEEDFEGFTKKDVQKSERKLKELLAKQESNDDDGLSPTFSGSAGTRIAKRRESLDNLPTSERTRNREKTIVRKSYTELLKQGTVKPSTPYTVKQAQEETRKALKIKLKLKKQKSDISTVQPSRKSIDKKSVKVTPKFKSEKGQGHSKSEDKGHLIQKGNKKYTSLLKTKGRKSKDSVVLSEEVSPYRKKKTKERDKDEKQNKVQPVQSSKVIKDKKKLAKQLLEKARKGQKVVKSQKSTSPVTTPKSPKSALYHRRQFVLPTQSSRSSRVIIPNKRFLEDDSFNQIVMKRTRVEETPRKTESFPVTSPVTKMVDPIHIPDHGDPPKPTPLTSLSPGLGTPPLIPSHQFDPLQVGQPLYDQPLIVEGKRARKPSLKVRMKLTEERIQAFQVKSFEKKLEARKTIEAEKAGVIEAKKVHLTPSKLEGAVTSPSKLPTSPIFAPPKFGVRGVSALSERQRLEALEKEALATRRKGHNILRKAKLQLSRAALNRSKAEFARTLKKEMKMEAKLEKIRLKQSTAVGSFNQVSGYSTFAGVAKSYMDAKNQPAGQEKYEGTDTVSPHKALMVCAVCKDPNLPPLRRRNYYGVPTCDSCRRFYRVHMKRTKEKEFSCNGNCETDIRRCVYCRYKQCQQVFPAEDKLKPLKESPSKRVEHTEGIEASESLLSPTRTVSTSPMATGTSPGETEGGTPVIGPVTSSPESLTSSPASEGRGPRIKHVCRKAAVVLGKPVAKFPQRSSAEITLSALPRGEKVKLWKKEEETKAELSDDERTMDEIIQQSEDSVCSVKKSPLKSPAQRSLKFTDRYGTGRKRKLRCKTCPGCLAQDCGKCIHCLDKPKFGGRGVMKQACVNRKCENPRYRRAATDAFIKPKDPEQKHVSGSKNNDESKDQPEVGPDHFQHSAGDTNGDPNTKRSSNNGTGSSMSLIRRMVLQSQGNQQSDGGVKLSSDSDLMSRTPADISRQLLPHFTEGVSRENLSQKNGRQSPLIPPYRSGDLSKKSSVLSPKKFSKGKDRNMTVLRSEQCVLQPLPSTMKNWSGLGFNGHRIKAEFKENYDIDQAWMSGVPLTMSSPLCVRTVCFLCGSAGKYEFVFCNVCCEPFHEFCLEEDERPSEDNIENWCCRKCQFCHVCGEQYNLLRCDKCQNTYHPECLGPNYPTKPSKKKKIWVCTKCVRCKSCGSTTPGNAGHATWTYDFQLCYECGKLMDKGNFCPLCHKCYSDDDWESKMVQCVTCESWVHAKCEGLTDEMYERVSVLPEDVHYICKICSPGDRSRHWELVLQDDLQAGIKSVFYTLLGAKCAQHLLHREVKKEMVQKQEKPDVIHNTPLEVTEENRDMNETLSKTITKDSGNTGGDMQETIISNSHTSKLGTENSVSTIRVGELEHKSSHSSSEQIPMSNDSKRYETVDTDMGMAAGLATSNCDSNVCDNEEAANGGGVTEVGGATMTEGSGNAANCDTKKSVKSDVESCDSVLLENQVLKQQGAESATNCESALKRHSNGAASDNEKCDESFIDSVTVHCNAELEHNDSADRTVQDDKSRDNIRDSKIDSNKELSVADQEKNIDVNSTDLKDEVDGGQHDQSAGVEGSDVTAKCTESELSDSQQDQNCQSHKSSTRFDQSVISYSHSTNQSVISNSHSTNQSVIISDTETKKEEKLEQDECAKSEFISQTENELKKENDTKNKPCDQFVTNVQETSKGDKSESEMETKNQVYSNSEGAKIIDTQSENSTTPGKNLLNLSPSADLGLVTPKKVENSSAHVHFSEKCGSFRQALPARDYPQDFEGVKNKMLTNSYNSVEEFSEDMAHIISQAMNDPNEQKAVRKKNNNSVRSMFVKQMERCFPWFNMKTCKLWEQNQNFPAGMLPDAVLPPTEDHTYAQWLERQDTPKSPQPSPFKKLHNTPIRKVLPIAVDEDAEKVLSCDLEDAGEDMRRCILCWHYGDADPNEAGRLLYAGQDDWIHINCALWSAEAYEEEQDGSLQNVHAAVSRGKLLKCDRCNRSGATVGCCTRGCPANYHFMCARLAHCVFQEDKKVFCCIHRDKVDGDLVSKDRFVVHRRVLVNMAEVKWAKKTWAKGLDPSVINVLIGSCTVESLGRLIPSSDHVGCLLPVEYSCTRVFWSTKDARRRCVYTCRIVEVKPSSPKSVQIVVKDTTIVHDKSHPDYVPLETLDIPGVNLFPDLNQACNNDGIKSDVIDLSNNSCEMSDDSITYLSTSFSNVSGQGLSASYNGSSSVYMETNAQSDVLSSSWPPMKKKTEKTHPVDFSLLSPKTLKLLNIKDPEKYKKSPAPVPPPKPPTSNVVEENKFSGFLTKIAERLNQAAARNVQRKSEERSHSPLCGRPRSRSSSVDRILPSAHSRPRSSSVERFLPSPPPRSRSSSVERERFGSSPNIHLESELGNSGKLLPDLEKSYDSVTSELDGNNTSSTVSAEETTDQSGVLLDSSLEPITEEGYLNQENLNETVIVLPEDIGELTEEDMVAIAQAALQQQEGATTDEQMGSVDEEQNLEQQGETIKEGENLQEEQMEATVSQEEITQKEDKVIFNESDVNGAQLKDDTEHVATSTTNTRSGSSELDTDISMDTEDSTEKYLEQNAQSSSSQDAVDTESNVENKGQITSLDFTEDSKEDQKITDIDLDDVIILDNVKGQVPEADSTGDCSESTDHTPHKTGDNKYLCTRTGLMLETMETDYDDDSSGTETVQTFMDKFITEDVQVDSSPIKDDKSLDITQQTTATEKDKQVNMDSGQGILTTAQSKISKALSSVEDNVKESDDDSVDKEKVQIEIKEKGDDTAKERGNDSFDMNMEEENRNVNETEKETDYKTISQDKEWRAKEAVCNDGKGITIDLTLTDEENETRPSLESRDKTDATSVKVEGGLIGTKNNIDILDVDEAAIPTVVCDTPNTAVSNRNKIKDSQIIVRTSPLHFLRPIQEPTITTKPRNSSSKLKSTSLCSTKESTLKESSADRGTKDKRKSVDTHVSDEEMDVVKKVTNKCDSMEELGSENEIPNTIHVNIYTKSDQDIDDEKMDSAVPGHSDSSDRENNDASNDTTTAVDLDEPLQRVSAHQSKESLTNNSQGQEVHEHLVEPIYDKKNNLIGHRIVISDNDEKDQDVAQPAVDGTASPTSLSDIWNIVVKELDKENSEKLSVTDSQNFPELPALEEVSQQQDNMTSVSDLIESNANCGKAEKGLIKEETNEQFDNSERDAKCLSKHGEDEELIGDSSKDLSKCKEIYVSCKMSGVATDGAQTSILKYHAQKPDIPFDGIKKQTEMRNQNTEISDSLKNCEIIPIKTDEKALLPSDSKSDIKTNVKLYTEEEKRREREKTEILKGLGLARTPTRNDKKSSCDSGGKSPRKKYPLRHRLSGSGHSEDFSVEQEEELKCETKLPIHVEIAQKIKAESLAKSIPGAKGPFKCPTCKRLYRTRESFKTHVKSCDFEVSTSDEEEEEEDVKIVENVEESSEGKRRYSVREHTVEARKAMAGDMRVREELQKLNRPAKRLADSDKRKRKSNVIGTTPKEDFSPPLKRGRGRPRLNPESKVPTNYKGIGQVKGKFTSITHNRKGHPRLKTFLLRKAKKFRENMEKKRDSLKAKVEVKKRGRPPLKKNIITKDREQEVNVKKRGRSSLKNVTPVNEVIIRKRGRPSLKSLAPQKDASEERVPAKRGRPSLKGLSSPNSPQKMCSPAAACNTGSPRKRGRPRKTPEGGRKISADHNTDNPTRSPTKQSTETLVSDIEVSQEVADQKGEITPIRKRGRPPKNSPDKMGQKLLNENEKETAVKTERPSLFEVFADMKSDGNSPEPIPKLGRPRKKKRNMKVARKIETSEKQLVVSNALGDESNTEPKDKSGVKGSSPAKQSASMNRQRFDMELESETEGGSSAGRRYNRDDDPSPDINDVEGEDVCKEESDIVEKTRHHEGLGKGKRGMKMKQQPSADGTSNISLNNGKNESLNEKKSDEGDDKAEVVISSKENNKSDVIESDNSRDNVTKIVEKKGAFQEKGTSEVSAIVIDSETEEDQDSDNEESHVKACDKMFRSQGTEIGDRDLNGSINLTQNQSATSDIKSSYQPVKESRAQMDKIVMIGAGLTKSGPVSTGKGKSVQNSGDDGQDHKTKSTENVQVDEADLGQGISVSLNNTDSETSIKIKIKEAPSASSSGIGNNMKHPTTPMSIRDLLHQKMASTPVSSPGYQVLTIRRPNSKDTLKEDIKSILPVLPTNILDQLKDPKQRLAAVKAIQDLIKLRSKSPTAGVTLSYPDAVIPGTTIPLPPHLRKPNTVKTRVVSQTVKPEKEAVSVNSRASEGNFGINTRNQTPVSKENRTDQSYCRISPNISSVDSHILSPAAAITGFQMIPPMQTGIGGAVVSVPSNVPFHVAAQQQLPQQIPLATQNVNQLPQLSPQIPVRPQSMPLLSATGGQQYIGDLAVQQLQSPMMPFNIASTPMAITSQGQFSFNIGSPSPSVLGLSSPQTPAAQSTVLMGPPTDSFSIPHLSTLGHQPGLHNLNTSSMINMVARQMPSVPQGSVINDTGTAQKAEPMAVHVNSQNQSYIGQPSALTQYPAGEPMTATVMHSGTSSSQPVSMTSVEEMAKKNSNTLVRIFVDGKPVAVTTDPSVISNRDKLLSRLGPSNLQAGTYSITVSTHKLSMSTNTMTVAGKSHMTDPKSSASRVSDNRVLQSLLSKGTVVKQAALNTGMYARPLLPSVINPEQKLTENSQQHGTIRKISPNQPHLNTFGSVHSYVKKNEGTTRKPMIKPNIIHKRRTGNSLLSKNMMITMEKNGVTQGALAKALMRKLVKTSTELSPKKKIVFRGIQVPEKLQLKRSADGVVKITKSATTGPETGSGAGKSDKPRLKLKPKIVKSKISGRRKTPLKPRNIAMPRVTGVMSHPIIHTQKDLMSLPQPAVEEEITDTPLSLLNTSRGQSSQNDSARRKHDPSLLFEIQSDDGFSCQGSSMEEVWSQVTEKLQDARVAARMKQLSFQSTSGASVFALNHSALRYLTEQLYGAQHCRNYQTLFHHYDISPEEEEPAENPTGCIRTEGYQTRKPFDMFSFLMSMYRRKPDPVPGGKNDVEMTLKSQRRATSMDLPMAMRFRKLKEHSREAVGVYRSPIHGRGLFCKRNIDVGEMIIEYAGEVIRASLTDKREKYYESKGIGCYMFRIDDVDVVDATMRGSAARFINHSCEPNCYSKVIQVDGKKHIVIFAMRAIRRGEELTYDYKFPIEEVKIPCTCGQKRCRKYLN